MFNFLRPGDNIDLVTRLTSPGGKTFLLISIDSLLDHICVFLILTDAGDKYVNFLFRGMCFPDMFQKQTFNFKHVYAYIFYSLLLKIKNTYLIFRIRLKISISFR